MKFLIVRLSSLGDIVHSLPLVHFLKKNYPNSQIDWLTSENGFELLSLIREISNVFISNLKNLIYIQKQKYDYVIDVQGLLKSAVLSKLSFGNKIIGFKNTREFADLFYDEKIDVGSLFKTNSHIVDLNLKLLTNLVKDSNTKIKFLIPKIGDSDIADVVKDANKKRSVAVFPATTWESKHWPYGYWFDLLANLSNDFNIFLCASSSDLVGIKNLIDKLDSAFVPHKNLVGKTNMRDLIYLIQNTNLVIGMDSLGLHLASAIRNDYGYPDIIGIYGPTSPIRNGPYNLTQNCLYLSDLECIACRKKNCPLGHHACMNNILPSYVSEMVYSKLSTVS